MSGNKHGAAASALGYLYQFDWALLEALEAYPRFAQRRLSIELLDDLAWHSEDGQAVLTLEQLKHHGDAAGELTDMQTDVWSTIAVWLDAGAPADPEGPALILVTTQAAATGSAMEQLRPAVADAPVLREERVARATELLETAARSSKAAGTHKTRERFLAIGPAARRGLVSRMTVLDGASPIHGLEERLVAAVGHAMPAQSAAFLERLRGWWAATVLRLLTGQQTTVRVLDVHGFVSRLRDEFADQNLPTTVSQEDVQHLLPGGTARRFVRQLEWVGHAGRYIELAILDYFRAYEQRARWAMDDLIGFDELARFEVRLREDWERRFQEVVAELPPGADEQAKAAAGRALLTAVMNDASVLVREHYRERFFAVGTRHALADADDVSAAIGWHPDFRQHLAELLSSSAA